MSSKSLVLSSRTSMPMQHNIYRRLVQNCGLYMPYHVRHMVYARTTWWNRRMQLWQVLDAQTRSCMSLRRCCCELQVTTRLEGKKLLDSQASIVQNQHKYRSEEHTSELQSLMRISYAVFCLKKKTTSK